MTATIRYAVLTAPSEEELGDHGLAVAKQVARRGKSGVSYAQSRAIIDGYEALARQIESRVGAANRAIEAQAREAEARVSDASRAIRDRIGDEEKAHAGKLRLLREEVARLEETVATHENTEIRALVDRSEREVSDFAQRGKERLVERVRELDPLSGRPESTGLRIGLGRAIGRETGREGTQ